MALPQTRILPKPAGKHITGNILFFNMSNDLKHEIQERLQSLQPSHLEVIDESHLHAGHAGSQNGARHFRVVLWSAQFDGLSTIARHRKVYDLLADLIPFPIHALAIHARPNP